MRRKATPEQIAKAKEKRAKVRDIAKRIAAMTEEQRRAMIQDWPTTIEGHAVSVKNACLVAFMRPGATVIGGFHQWRKAGRPIKAGEHSTFFIWVPLKGKKKDDESAADINEDGERTNFALVPMFDISQTQDENAAIAKDEAETGLESMSAERLRDLAILDNAPTEPPAHLNDEEEAALAREFARERAEEEQFAIV